MLARLPVISLEDVYLSGNPPTFPRRLMLKRVRFLALVLGTV